MRSWERVLLVVAACVFVGGLMIPLQSAPDGDWSPVTNQEAATLVGGTCYDWTQMTCYQPGYLIECSLEECFRYGLEDPDGLTDKRNEWCGEAYTNCDTVTYEFDPCMAS